MTLNSSITHLTFFSLRLAFFLACKRYVHHSLLNDLNRVTITSTRTSSSSPATTTITTTAITTTAITTTTTSSSSSSSSSHQIGNPLDLTSKSSTPDSIPSPDHHPSSIIPSSHSKSFIHQLLNQNIIQSSSNSKHVVHQFISSTISILLFCWTFSEGSLLFSIVVLGSWLDPHARDFNWNLSLTILISSVVFIVPFLECLLFSTSILSRRPKPNERMRLCSIRTLGLTSLPFGIYLFVYYRLGQIIQGLLGVESGSHKFGFLNTTLARICVPGVILIASLSGGGAVNTAWLTWEWRNREKEPPVTDQQIAAAEKSLTRTRTDLAGRKSILQQQMNHSPNKPDGSSSLLNTLFTGSSSSNPKTTQLQQEIAGLEAMEIQIINDINLLKGHKESYAYSRTIPGMLFNIANWLLSVYCIYRLFMACVNLIFGYVKQPSSRGGSTTSGSPTTDIVTYLVAKILMTFSIELEITKLSRLVGLVLIGSIILVNLRAVLVWVHRVFNRLGSSGISSSLMLLVLGQLMAMYLLTCLISLPSSASTSIDDSNGSSSSVPGGTSKSGPEGGSSSRTEDLLNTLPSFSRFSKLFDLVFLSTGILTFLIRWLIKQIQDPNSTSSSFSLYLPTPISNGSTDESIVLNQRLGAHFV